MLHLVRRVRCDETKPSCTRCLSTFRRCDGYASTVQNPATTPPCSLTPPPSLFDSSINERRALYYFHGRTSSQLSGFYNCEFWNIIVLQIASQDEGVRHGLVALASMHEEFEKEGSLFDHDSGGQFGLVQYNLAIRRHLEQVQRRDLSVNVETLVAPCLIFICIEVCAVASVLQPKEEILE